MDHGAETVAIPWSSDTNWIVDHGSLDASIVVESSHCPIPESDLESRNSPLILKPHSPDSGPCEFKIHFEQKFDIYQIYVRSTARVYEIYYAHTSHGSNEYLCTVRCGVAERDGKVLQTAFMEDVYRHRDSSSEELTEETAVNGGSTSNGEDDWVKIKTPDAGISSSDRMNSDRIESMQDLYEATAQISDAEPCSVLTIRLLSLQDKEYLYVDEIYLFADPAELVDSGNEAALAGSSTQSSLMAMMIPTLLKLSKSGVSRVQDKRVSEEVLKDDKTEARSKEIGQIDVGLHKNQVQQYVESKVRDKDTSQSAEPWQPNMENNIAETANKNTLPAGNLENTLEQLVSRLSRMEDTFLRFEEKMLRPIESIEARLQRVELQIEKLVQSSLGSGLPNSTGICTPALSCSESNSSSLCNNKNDFLTRGHSDIEKKDLSCDGMAELPQSLDTKLRPGLLVSAPSFTYDEDEGDDVSSLEDSPCIKPKKALSVDDALAAALSGFLSTALNHSSVDIKEPSGCSIEVDQENQHQELEGLHETNGQELFPVGENTDGESLQYTQVLSIKAPDFNADESGNEDELKDFEASLNMASVCENEEKGHDDEVASSCSQSTVPFSSVYSYHFCKNGSGSGFELENNSLLSAVPIEATNNDSAFELGKDFVETDTLLIEDASEVLEKNVIAAEKCIEDEIPHTSDPSSSLDFEYPILDVKFLSDVSSNPKSPLEALLYGSVSSSTEPHPIHECLDDDGSPPVISCTEATNSLPGSSLLVDIGVSGSDEASNTVPGSHNSPASSPTTFVNLI